MEYLMRYMLIFFLIVLVISIILAVMAYNANQYCITHENPNCPTYTCAQLGGNPGQPAYRYAADGSTQCSSRSNANATGDKCAPLS